MNSESKPVISFRCSSELKEAIDAETEIYDGNRNAALCALIERAFLSVPLDKISQLPQEPGIYLVYQKEGLLYLGSSVSMRKRLRTHNRMEEFKAANFDSPVYIAAFPINTQTRQELYVEEQTLLSFLTPPLNKTYQCTLSGKSNQEKLLAAGYTSIFIELPRDEKKLLDNYCKHMQQTKTEVLRGLIKQLSYPEGERCHWLLKLEFGKTHAAIVDEYCKRYGVVPSEAVREAIILLAQHYVLSVEAKDAEAFVAAIENPPEPNEELKQLMRTEAPWNELKQRDNLTPISKSEIRPWLQSLVDEAEQDLAIADQLRTMGEQLLAIAKVIEDR